MAEFRGNSRIVFMWGAVLAGLYLASLYSYLLFHSLVEIFSVIVACGIFIIAWNARRMGVNNYFLFVGIGSLFVGAVDFTHALAYKGMGVFPGYDANLPTQLWIVSRYLQGFTLIAAPFFIGRQLKSGYALAAYLVVTVLLLGSVFGGIFPDCFIEGKGLTPFKRINEYLTSLVLLGSLLFMREKAKEFDLDVVRLLSIAISTLIAAGLAFTLYADVYGISNLVGHFLKFVGFYLIYKAIIETALTRPYDLLFRELKLSEERYRHLYTDTPVMLHSIDRERKLVNVSNYWLEHLGFERSEVIGRRLIDFITEESRRYVEEFTIPEYFRTGHIKDVPLQLVRKNGDVRDVLLAATAERDEQGEIVRSLAVMMDVTDRKRAEEKIEVLNTSLAARALDLEKANLELEAANQELEAFNYTVSHDLRSPLTCINGYCEILREQWSERLDEQGRRFIDHIHDAARRMEQLIATLLDFSRLTRQEMKRETVDLSHLVSSIVLDLRLRHPGHTVTSTIADGIVANGDGKLLRVVFENLLGNAWKYSGRRADAMVEFGVLNEKGKKVYFVRDNGVGFDTAEAGKLFNLFQRLDSARDFEGTGIGLVTVRRIIQRHGGDIWAEGKTGEGATFFFTLA
ncbi:MAG: PAS domain-containing sensor histidine kinase [Geobacter sp.]|nr:MAG: PAS domain-containing sensor histidine kinase [Geobacter sp.]